MTQQVTRTNTLGVIGFIVSLAGIFTLGILCPVGLILSFVALFKRPRGFAFAGFVIGLIGSLVPVVLFLIFGWAIFACFSFASPMVGTVTHAEMARQDINKYYRATGMLPTEPDGDRVIAGEKDGWGRPFVYQREGTIGFEIRSAGKDGILNNEDDYHEIFTAPTSSSP